MATSVDRMSEFFKLMRDTAETFDWQDEEVPRIAWLIREATTPGEPELMLVMHNTNCLHCMGELLLGYSEYIETLSMLAKEKIDERAEPGTHLH